MSNQSNQNNHFNTRSTLQVNQQTYTIFNLNALPADFAVSTLPYSLKILLENLLRCENGRQVTAADIEALAKHDPTQPPTQEIAFTPSRVLLQDFTGVPAIVDLAAMREAMRRLQGDPGLINPLQTAELVIDHSVQVDDFGHADSLVINTDLEFARNRERYEFLRWGQQAFSNFTVVPPDMGIVHQINLEYLARGVFTRQQGDEVWAYPDTLVGTDSHTTMINGLGVLGWGVGGIEAEAALLGQAISMLIPAVVGFELTGQLPEGTTATDLVLTITQQLRAHGVVGKLVEFYGAGLDHLPLADRATIANMAPEYGATCGFFPIDQETLRYLQLSGRDPQHIALVEAYSKAQGLFRQADMSQCRYSERLRLDMSTVRASIAGPKRPQDRMDLSAATAQFQQQLPPATAGSGHAPLVLDGKTMEMTHGAIVIAAITSCTNTSNPSVMLAAGLLAKKACERGLKSAPWVKTSLSPGSKVVTEYLQQAGLLPYLQQLGFYHVGYGCMTCIGNSGPLPPEVSQAIQQGQLMTCAVLSGNRNFEGRIHAEVRLNYLVSPPLVVAYALTGNMNIDISREALGLDSQGNPVFLRDIWPSQQEINQALSQINATMFRLSYANINRGDAHWNALAAPTGELFAWDERSTYIKHPPFFADIQLQPATPTDIHQARVLAWLGDSVTTDHISPAGSIKPDSPAGVYLQAQGVAVKDFNSYGARRGNHEVMMRGTFANTRLRNRLAPGTEGGWTRYGSESTPVSIYDAAMRYQQAQIPLIILAGKEYGSGSSRDWAAKGPRLLGIQAVIAESYERIHRSNLVGMGILPLQFRPGETAESLGLTGTESYSIQGIQGGNAKTVHVIATAATGSRIEFMVGVRMDTPQEIEYYQHGGILPFVLRQLLGSQHHG